VNIRLLSVGDSEYTLLLRLGSGTGFIAQSGFEDQSVYVDQYRSKMIILGTLLIVLIGISYNLRSRARTRDIVHARDKDTRNGDSLWRKRKQ
jgi:hypothetical protein